MIWYCADCGVNVPDDHVHGALELRADIRLAEQVPTLNYTPEEMEQEQERYAAHREQEIARVIHSAQERVENGMLPSASIDLLLAELDPQVPAQPSRARHADVDTWDG